MALHGVAFWQWSRLRCAGWPFRVEGKEVGRREVDSQIRTLWLAALS